MKKLLAILGVFGILVASSSFAMSDDPDICDKFPKSWWCGGQN